jgi:hypothetical protein
MASFGTEATTNCNITRELAASTTTQTGILVAYFQVPAVVGGLGEYRKTNRTKPGRIL